MSMSRLNLPNAISLIRILACPILFALLLSPEISHLLTAFFLFSAAAVSDLWDGYLARKHGWVTDTGKLLDPLADKLLLVATFLPFYIVSHRPDPLTDLPWWGPLPLWVVAVIFGREILVTLARSWAARRGSVISSGWSGKVKSFVQNIFSGSLILWYVLIRAAEARGWEGDALWVIWAPFHATVLALALGLAVFLTVYSMGLYYWQNRALIHGSGEFRR